LVHDEQRYLGQRTSSGAVRDFAVPGGKVYSLRADRGGLWVGSAGYGTRGLLRVDSKHRVRHFCSAAAAGSRPTQITADARGDLWFAARVVCRDATGSSAGRLEQWPVAG